MANSGVQTKKVSNEIKDSDSLGSSDNLSKTMKHKGRKIIMVENQQPNFKKAALSPNVRNKKVLLPQITTNELRLPQLTTKKPCPSELGYSMKRYTKNFDAKSHSVHKN